MLSSTSGVPYCGVTFQLDCPHCKRMPDHSENHSLSDVAIQIAECYAIAYPEAPGRAKALQWINRARKAVMGKTGIQAARMGQAIDELVDAGILSPSIEGKKGVSARGPMANVGHITRFCTSAVERGTADILLDLMADAMDPHPYAYRSYHRQENLIEQRTRIALISGDFSQYADRNLPMNIWGWLTESDAAPLMERLPGYHRMMACNFGLASLSHYLKPMGEFASLVDRVEPNEMASTLIARAHIFQGRFAKAESLLDDAEVNQPGERFFEVESLSQRAMIATLKGDDSQAYQLVQKAMEAERSGTRKRIVYPDTASFSMALLCLVRLNSTESRSLMKKLITAREKLDIDSELHILLLAADAADMPELDRYNLHLPGRISQFSVLYAIASRWNPRFNLPDRPDSIRWLQDIALQAGFGGYKWALAEMLTVLEQQVSDTTQLDEPIRKLLKQAGGQQRLDKLRTPSLTHLVQTIEPWEYTLRELEHLAPAAGSAKGKGKKAESSRQRRLVWQLSGHSATSQHVSPVEQSSGKNGQWSAGRKVALKRLHEKADTMPHLIEQDIKASRSIEKHSDHGWSRTVHYETSQRTIYQLVGHPCVFDDQGQRVDVVEREPVLHLSEEDGKLRLRFEPERRAHRYQSELDTENKRLYVTRFTAAQARIDETLPDRGLVLPKDADERLHKLLNALSGDIQVQGDSDVTEQSLVEGDSEPFLAMEPYGQSLQVRLRVEPLPESGSYFDAGTGGSVVYVQGPKGSVSVQRDLAVEQQKMQHLVTQSFILSSHFDGRPHLVIDDPMDALELLEEANAAGIRCLWPQDMPFRIKARAGVSQMRLEMKSGTDWFAASGSLDLGDGSDALSLERLQQLIATQPDSRFVELGKGDFLALSETLKQQLDTLQAFTQPARSEKSDPQTHPMALLALDPLLENATIKGDKRWKILRDRVEQALSEKPSVPSALTADLRAYQRDGFAWLAQLGQVGAGACLADDMGLGKTLQALTVLLARAEQGPALVVAPTSVLGNWLQEAQRFAPTLNVLAYSDHAQQRRDLLSEIGAHDVLVISYGLLVNDIDYLKPIHWHSVVLDEAQAIKNAATRRAKCARELQADFRMVTTGTPVQNNLMDLHSLFRFLNPRLLGSDAAFRKRFAVPISRDQDVRAREQLQALVTPFLLRRHKRDVLKELPARTELVLDVSLSSEEAQLYETIRQQALDSLQEKGRANSLSKQKIFMLAALTRLRRLCCNPVLVAPDWKGPASKLAVFAETLDELIASGHKALVFSQFVDHLKIIEAHLQSQSISYQYIDGSVSARERTNRVSRFQSGDGEVFLISLTAGGTGLNLTAADYVIHLDPWWNPAVEDQASDRAHRLGQQRPVTIVRMVTTGTVEEQIQHLHGSKRDLADAVLAGANSPSLDAEAMMQLLKGGQPSDETID